MEDLKFAHHVKETGHVLCTKEGQCNTDDATSAVCVVTTS